MYAQEAQLWRGTTDRRYIYRCLINESARGLKAGARRHPRFSFPTPVGCHSTSAVSDNTWPCGDRRIRSTDSESMSLYRYLSGTSTSCWVEKPKNKAPNLPKSFPSCAYIPDTPLPRTSRFVLLSTPLAHALTFVCLCLEGAALRCLPLLPLPPYPCPPPDRLTALSALFIALCPLHCSPANRQLQVHRGRNGALLVVTTQLFI